MVRPARMAADYGARTAIGTLPERPDLLNSMNAVLAGSLASWLADYFFRFFLHRGVPSRLCLHLRFRLQQLLALPCRPGQTLGVLAGQVPLAEQIWLPGGVLASAQAGQVVWPLLGCAVPAGQAVHVVSPATGCTKPAGHWLHVS